MNKIQKIILIITTITIIVGVMVIPSFAYTINEDGSFTPVRVNMNVPMTQQSDGSSYGELVFDLDQYCDPRDTALLLCDVWAPGEQQYTKSLTPTYNWISRTITTEIADVGSATMYIIPPSTAYDSYTIHIEFRIDSSYRWCREEYLQIKFCVYPTVPAYESEVREIISNINSENANLESELANLESVLSNLEREYERLSVEAEGLRNTNAIEAFVNGLANGFNSFLDIVSGFSVGGITLGSVITLAVVGIVILILIKFIL